MDTEKTSTNQPDPQLLYDRARNAAFELLKTLVTFSSAAVAAYFVTLTGETTPPLTCEQYQAVTGALWCMVIAVFSGVVAWGADAYFYDSWAKYLKKNEAKFKRLKVISNHTRRIFLWILVLSFLAGLVESGMYLKQRASSSTGGSREVEAKL